MPNLRGILTVSIPVVSVLLGFLWYFGRKRPKQKGPAENGEDQKDETQTGMVNSNHVSYSSPSVNRKRKACQISRAEKLDDDDDEDDSVEEELEGTGEKIPLINTTADKHGNDEHLLPIKEDLVKWETWENTEVKQKSDVTQGCEESVDSSQKETGLCEKSDTVNERDQSNSLPVNETILVSDKSTVLNEAFMTTGISEQSILSEDRQDKVEDISLSTSRMEEPLLESTMIDNLNCQPSKGPSHLPTQSDLSDINDLSARLESSMALSAENYSVNSHDSKPAAAESATKHSQSKSSPTSKNTPTKILSRKENNTDKRANKNSTQRVSPEQERWRKDSYKKSEKSKASSVVSPERQSHRSGGSDSVSDKGSDASYLIDNPDNGSESSNDSGKGRSVTGTPASSASSPSHMTYHFNFPTPDCGRLIGKNGRNINIIKENSGASIALTSNPFTADFQLCVVEGTQKQIDRALQAISRRFPEVDMTPINIPNKENSPPQAPVLMPEIMQLNLPEGVSVDVMVTSIVDTGHLFLQQPTHPSFPSLERLNQFMNMCYMQDGIVPQLPRPIEVGVICASPFMDSWYRAQITAVYDDTDECDIKYVDYGGFSRINGSSLRQIRSDFMTLPFQACECYLANVTPLQDEEYFSPESAGVLEELTQGKVLQAQVVGRGDDGVPYVHIYQINGEKVVFVNRELVNRGLARWIEILS